MQALSQADSTAAPLAEPGADLNPAAVYRVIRSRRNVAQFESAPVPREQLLRLLDAARWAPNHGLNEPWRFLVVEREARATLANLARIVTLEGAKDPDNPATIERAIRKQEELLAAPVVLFVFALPDPDGVVAKENYGAACCAVQNLLLAARAEGLGGRWSTGWLAKEERVWRLLGVPLDYQLVGMIRLGKVAREPNGRRRPIEEFVRWVDRPAERVT